MNLNISFPDFLNLSGDERRQFVAERNKAIRQNIRNVVNNEILHPMLEDTLVPKINFVDSEPEPHAGTDEEVREFLRVNPDVTSVRVGRVEYSRGRR